MASTVYKAAKKEGLASALSVPASDITITGFTLGVRRLHVATGQLLGFDEVELTDGAVLVLTSFEVEAADISTATALSTTIAGASSAVKVHTDNAMAVADWSGEPLIVTAPSMTAVVMASPTVVVPTPAPTPELPPNSGPNIGPVSGVGDPHLTNMYGERFDVYRTGVIILLQIPRMVGPQDTLLHLEADARRLGDACSEVFFQTVRISGAWTNQSAGITFFAKSSDRPNRMAWTRFGRIDVKVVNGKTREGLEYLNVYARKLGKAQHPVGGLLGGDTDATATTPEERCAHAMALAAY